MESPKIGRGRGCGLTRSSNRDFPPDADQYLLQLPMMTLKEMKYLYQMPILYVYIYTDVY